MTYVCYDDSNTFDAYYSCLFVFVDIYIEMNDPTL
jgi:hypothetical protein